MSLFTKTNPGNETGNKRLKLLLWGESGMGKTTAALSFPNVVVLDIIEMGTAEYRNDYSFSYMQADTLEQADNAISELAKGGHDFKTLVIDPLTLYTDTVLEMHLANLRKQKGDPLYDLQASDYRPIKRATKGFVRRAMALDMNIIFIARAKAFFTTKWNQYKKKNEMVVDGICAAVPSDLIYELDLSMQLTKDGATFAWAKEKFRGSRLKAIPDRHTYEFGSFYESIIEFMGDRAAVEADAKVTVDQVHPQSVLIAKLGELGIGGLSAQYEAYVAKKYELSNVSDISPQEIQEQRALLNKLKGNDERLGQFKEMLQGITTTTEEGE